MASEGPFVATEHCQPSSDEADSLLCPPPADTPCGQTGGPGASLARFSWAQAAVAAAVCALLLGAYAPGAAGLEWVFLVSIGLFGVAHGACDLWLPGWVRGGMAPGWFIAGFVAAYLGLACAVLVFWVWWPDGAAAEFLLLTAWHWGSADAVLTGSRGPGFLLFGWGRGLMVMAAPACFHPAATSAVLRLLDAGGTGGLTPARLRAVAGVILAGALAMQMFAAPPRRADLRAVRAAVETLFLLGLYAALDPLVSTALYFVWFHAWRHIVRLMAWQSPGKLPLARRLARFHWAALPCGLGALALLWAVAQARPGNLLRAYLILLSALTLPHALLVSWLDRVEHRRGAIPA